MLELEDVDEPVIGDGDVLVRVRAASVNPRDWHFLRGLPYVMRPTGLRIPKDGGLGSDLAGEVEAVGRDVRRFRPGDAVHAHVEAGATTSSSSWPGPAPRRPAGAPSPPRGRSS